MSVVREVLFTPPLGRGRSSHQICPCLRWVQGKYSATPDSNDVIARKFDWFAPQHRTGSEICRYHKVSRQVWVVGEWFLELSL